VDLDDTRPGIVKCVLGFCRYGIRLVVIRGPIQGLFRPFIQTFKPSLSGWFSSASVIRSLSECKCRAVEGSRVGCFGRSFLGNLKYKSTWR